MFVSARIFLILLVPLLVHGAPTSTPDPHSGNPFKDVSWLPDDYEFVASGKLLPLPSHARTNPALPVDSTAANLLKFPMFPQIIPTILVSNKPHTSCRFPIDSYYRLPPSPVEHAINKVIRIDADRIVITPRGKTILVPRGSMIDISEDGHTYIPAMDTDIREVDKKNMDKVKKFCKEIYDGTPIDPGLELLDEYVLRCSDINFWNIGLPEFEKVPVKRKRLGLITRCVLPSGSTYRVLLSGTNCVLGPALTQEDRVVRTPQGEIILLPERTTVSTSSDPRQIYEPIGSNTDIRKVSKHDELGIQGWCRDIHSRARKPHGWQRERVEGYVVRCSDINYWRIIEGNFVVVPVYVNPSKKRKPSGPTKFIRID